MAQEGRYEELTPVTSDKDRYEELPPPVRKATFGSDYAHDYFPDVPKYQPYSQEVPPLPPTPARAQGAGPGGGVGKRPTEIPRGRTSVGPGAYGIQSPKDNRPFELQAIDILEKNPNLQVADNPFNQGFDIFAENMLQPPRFITEGANKFARAITEPKTTKRTLGPGLPEVTREPLDLSSLSLTPEKKAEIEKLHQSPTFESNPRDIQGALAGAIAGIEDPNDPAKSSLGAVSLLSPVNIALTTLGAGEYSSLKSAQALIKAGKLAEAAPFARTALNYERLNQVGSAYMGTAAGFEYGNVLGDPNLSAQEKAYASIQYLPTLAGAALGMRPRVKQNIFATPVGTARPPEGPTGGTLTRPVAPPPGPGPIGFGAVTVKPGPTQFQQVKRLADSGYRVISSDENGVRMMPTQGPLPTQARPILESGELTSAPTGGADLSTVVPKNVDIQEEHPFGGGESFLPEDEDPIFQRRPPPPVVAPMGDLRNPNAPQRRPTLFKEPTSNEEAIRRFEAMQTTGEDPSGISLTTPVGGAEGPLAANTPKRPFRSNPLRPDLEFESDRKWNTGTFPRILVEADRKQFARARALGLDPDNYKSIEEVTEAIHARRNELGLKPGEEPGEKGPLAARRPKVDLKTPIRMGDARNYPTIPPGEPVNRSYPADAESSSDRELESIERQGLEDRGEREESEKQGRKTYEWTERAPDEVFNEIRMNSPHLLAEATKIYQEKDPEQISKNMHEAREGLKDLARSAMVRENVLGQGRRALSLYRLATAKYNLATQRTLEGRAYESRRPPHIPPSSSGEGGGLSPREIQLKLALSINDPDRRNAEIQRIQERIEIEPEESIKLMRREGSPRLAEAEAIYAEQDPEKITDNWHKYTGEFDRIFNIRNNARSPREQRQFDKEYETTAELATIAAEKYHRTAKRLMEGRVDFAVRPTDASGRPLKAEEMTPEQADKYQQDRAKDWGYARRAAKELGIDIKGMRNYDEVMAKIAQAADEQAGKGPLGAKTTVAKGQKIESDVRRNAQELASGYNRALPGVIVREGLQNAIDAVKAMGSNPTTGEIHVYIGTDKISIDDPGTGMNLKALQTVYKDLNSSGKVSQAGATGGKGVGKAAIMLNGTRFDLTTVCWEFNKKVEYTLGGTPEDLLTNYDIDMEDDIDQNTPTGTIIETEYSNMPNAKVEAEKMFYDIIKFSRDLPVKITLSTDTHAGPPHNIQSFTDDTLLGEGTKLGNKFSVYIPNGVNKIETNTIEAHYLNNGMYQYTQTYYLPEILSDMPEHVLVNLEPVEEYNVDPVTGHEVANKDYPFNTTREGIKDNVRGDIIVKMNNVIASPGQARKRATLADYWNNITKMSVTGMTRSGLLFDSGNRLTTKEADDLKDEPLIKAFIAEIDSIIDETLTITNPNTGTGYLPDINWENNVTHVGVLLSDSTDGLYLPNLSNPGRAAILINLFNHIASHANPYVAATKIMVTVNHEAAHVGNKVPAYHPLTEQDRRDPNIGEYLESYLEENHIQAGISEGHGTDFVKRLSYIVAKVGPKAGMRYVNRIHKILADPQHPSLYRPTIQRLLQEYQTTRGRAETAPDPLSRTGIKSESEGGGEDLSLGDNAPDESRVFRDSSGGLGIPLAARARKPLRPPRTTVGGKVKRVQLKHEALAPDKQRELVKGAIDFGYRSTGFRDAQGLPIWEQPRKEKTNIVSESWNLWRGLTSVDPPFITSAVLRQGPTMLLVDPKSWVRAVVNSSRAYGSKATYEMIKDELSRNPYFQRGIDAQGNEVPSFAEAVNLPLTDVTNMTKREEVLKSSWAEKIPIWGRHVASSNRAYTAFVNTARAGALVKFADAGKLQAVLMKDPSLDLTKNLVLGREVADAIGTLTGRGKAEVEIFPKTRLGKTRLWGTKPLKQRKLSIEGAAVEKLANIFFSPRLQASRAKLLNINTYISASPQVRKMYIKGMMSLLAVWGTIGALAKFSGLGDIDLNPWSADFGKIRVGNTRFDPGAGFQQYLVLMARRISGKFTSSTSGNTQELREGFRPITPGELYQNFFTSKLHPSAKWIYDHEWATQDKPFYDIDRTIKLAAPMFAQGLNEVIQEEGWGTGLAVLLASGLGVGTQTYPDKKKEEKPEFTPFLENLSGIPITEWERVPPKDH